MCEYCGCQALEAIAEVTAEHDVVIELGRQVRDALRAGELDLAAERTRAVAAVLAPHTAVEEGALCDPGWPGRVEHVLDVLREHILKEQDGVFPAALALLDPEQWEAVDAVRARVGSVSRATV